MKFYKKHKLKCGGYLLVENIRINKTIISVGGNMAQQLGKTLEI